MFIRLFLDIDRHHLHVLRFLLAAPTSPCGSRMNRVKAYRDEQQHGLMAPDLNWKGSRGLLNQIPSIDCDKMVEQPVRKGQKPSDSNLIQRGWTNAPRFHFIWNENRNSLNLWISNISLLRLPWYWLSVQRPFALCWLGLNRRVFGTTLNAEPRVVISRTDSGTKSWSGTVFVTMQRLAASTHPPAPPFWPRGSSPAGQIVVLCSRSRCWTHNAFVGFCTEESSNKEGKNIPVVPKVHPPCFCF